MKYYKQKGQVVATQWTDKRTVNILSTSLKPMTETINQRTKNGPEQTTIPTPVLEPYKYMHGEDLMDQYRPYHPLGISGKE